MFNFLKNRNKKNSFEKIYINSAALLIHAAKIDENYQEEEKEIIKKTLIKLGVDEKLVEKLIIIAEEYERNSNQILEFTKEIKQMDQKFKIKIIETLWQIIYSDGHADLYESSLMRRLTGLMYLDNKLVAEIKKKIELKKTT
tara:strand:+ start:230 stop:655 length:426 start_codon:yes stop_codon:yes gene_type:complete